MFHDADPDVVAAVKRLHEREPCGDVFSLPAVVVVDHLHVAEIHVPVLVVFGAEDANFIAGAAQTQARNFSGSHDVTAVELPGTGHMVMLERSATQLIDRVSSWLNARGF